MSSLYRCQVYINVKSRPRRTWICRTGRRQTVSLGLLHHLFFPLFLQVHDCTVKSIYSQVYIQSSLYRCQVYIDVESCTCICIHSTCNWPYCAILVYIFTPPSPPHRDPFRCCISNSKSKFSASSHLWGTGGELDHIPVLVQGAYNCAESSFHSYDIFTAGAYLHSANCADNTPHWPQRQIFWCVMCGAAWTGLKTWVCSALFYSLTCKSNVTLD